ncbi:MAG: hypothetical protein ACE15B_23895 [Bryobacteraceae bacterium]
MHFRRLVSLLLGMWLGGCFFMALVATQNFRGVDRLLVSPAPQAQPAVNLLGAQARPLLRYQVSELNRWYFETWDTVQLGLGLLLLFLLVFATHEKAISILPALLMLLITILDRFLITPQIVDLGRALDFAADVRSSTDSRFWTLHATYSGLEVGKWVLGLLLAARLVLRNGKTSGHPRRKVDLVDEADHGHVNR